MPPETQAYALAKYSRSAQSMLESIAELSEQRAAEFLETFYFQYGHRSIADLAHLAMALENISILAAIRVVDEPLWDGQERSTRYQPFSRTKYHVPEGLTDGVRERFVAGCEELFAAYGELSKGLTELLKRVVPRPEEMDEGAYTRTLRARAFDVTRYLLPLATRTSVGQVVSARVLERQISRLLADPLPEARRIAEELRAACERPAEAPVLRKLLDPAGRDPHDAHGANGGGANGDGANGNGANGNGVLGEDAVGDGAVGEGGPGGLAALLETRAAPTLVKYTAPETYGPATYQALAGLAERLLDGLEPAPRPTGARPSVELAEPTGLAEELVATLLFRADTGRRSYRQILERVRSLPEEACRAVLDAALAGRGRHDDLLREHRAGYGLVFDVLMDVGGFRDMHRHRRCVQVVREPDPADGFDDPDELFRAGVGDDGAELARAAGYVERYRAALERAFATADELSPRLGIESRYLLPMAARVRALFKMDYAEAVYIAELRTGLGGHFSYRRVAWAMRQELARRHPVLAGPVRATDPYEVVDLLRR